MSPEEYWKEEWDKIHTAVYKQKISASEASNRVINCILSLDSILKGLTDEDQTQQEMALKASLGIIEVLELIRVIKEKLSDIKRINLDGIINEDETKIG